MLSAALALSLLLGAALAPVHGIPVTGLAPTLARRQSTGPPWFAAYSDKWVTGAAPSVQDIYGFNVFILSFLMASGAVDQAQNWEELDAATRSTIKSEYAAAGIKLMVSAFGSTDTPTSSGDDPTTTANNIAAWVIEYGVDVDYEDFTAMNLADGTAETWLTTFTQALRAQLPSGQYLITHAPVAPWFCGTTKYASGAYVTVNQNVGSLIDWYNVQFYNQGTSEYTTCTGLLTESSSTWPNSALFQINSNGGKPANTADASNGFMDTATLAGCVQQAQGMGWSGGVMTWEYPDAASPWIEAVRADSWPVSGSPPPPPPPPATTTAASAMPTSTASGGMCGGIAAWTSGVAYVGGDEVTYNGDLWTAKWWTENDLPGGPAGVWTDEGACS
ncbi:carbohydrate-binding module family 5 protein [Calocera cornea HHB12733]|uniref:Carbohydrate-binding module family 5 protein n=1 Tax=Calocera cornea HHB12733 TaxID=1353952 RepID=A0A165EA19_9BASI|nr:carbohydrate-binding module family 5 protein [Calocera cornea HHB12733]